MDFEFNENQLDLQKMVRELAEKEIGPRAKENDEKDIYYLTVNEKNFMEKMAEWHVELEDNKPEEISPWKEKI